MYCIEFTNGMKIPGDDRRPPDESTASHLGKAAIHKQLRSRDVTCVVGRKKHHGLRDLIGCAEPSKRNSVVNHLQPLLARI